MTWMYLLFGFLGLAASLPTIDMEISKDNADINGDDQDNRLSGSEISDTIRGGDGDGDDTLIGQAGNDYLYGEQGNDTLDGGADEDTLYGGVGVDSLTGGAADDYLFGEEGDDELYGDNATDSALTGGNDFIRGEEGNDKLYGGAGNDQLYGDHSYGQKGDSDGNDTLYGGAGNDQLIGGLGGSATDILYGGTGEDTLIGDDGADILYGGDGDDTLYMQGQDSVTGGDGEDDFRTGGWYDANSVLLKTGNDDFATIEDFSSSGNKSDLLIVEVPFDAADSFTLATVENPVGSGVYDVQLIKVENEITTETTVVAKVTNGGADLRVGDNLRIFRS